MLTELRAALVLSLAFLLFLTIMCWFALGMAPSPAGGANAEGRRRH